MEEQDIDVIKGFTLYLKDRVSEFKNMSISDLPKAIDLVVKFIDDFNEML